MTKPRLTYFDAPVSRGEECRLALHLAKVDFEDVRLKREEWAALKPKTPYGTVPILELEGKPILAHSNAILVYVGRSYGLHPKDAFEAAMHEAVLEYAEELRHHVGPSLRMSDPVEKKKVREALATTYLPGWAAHVERQIVKGPFFGGDQLNVVDIKLYSIVRWFVTGVVDHIPATVFADFPRLMGVHDAVREHPGVKAWYAR
jgi:glutathione S-transferase